MTVVTPTFRLSEKTHTGTVALKVANLAKMTDFYQDVIGLTLLEQTESTSRLGAGTTVLLELKKIANPAALATRTGLYHVAFLLPSRKELGNALLHYIAVKAPLVGASDHGYSEALYLNDPEGNGIEVYYDKEMSEWDIREDGEIVGVTLEMQVEEVIAASDRNWQGYPEGTTIGHVHLKVSDLERTEQFYTDTLGLTLKNNYGTQAKFFATGTYHHHIGSNIWMGRNIPTMAENDLGLAYFTFFTADQAELERLETHWQTRGVVYDKDSAGDLWIVDPNGIKIKFEVEK